MSTLTEEQKTAFNKIPSGFIGRLAGMGLSESQILDAWNDANKAVKEQRSANGELRKEAKETAEANKARKSKELHDRCDELEIPVPKLAKSLHRTDKKVGDKIVQVLVGAKFRAEGVSGSLDFYVTTGKGGKLTPKVEARILEAQALALKSLTAMEDAGIEVGAEDEE
jgi:hypothetical protein